MPINVENLRAVIRGRAMTRLEQGLRVGGDWMVEVLKATVSCQSGDTPRQGTAATSPHRYLEPGKSRARPWRRAEYTTRTVDKPPGMESGAGRESIGFQITDKDYDAGRMVLRLGVDGTARGGMSQLQSYMLGHELGIRYPTRGHGPRRLIQHPWLRSTIVRYFSEFGAIVVMTARS